MASKNIATYHPGTQLTHDHNMKEKIDYMNEKEQKYPYNQFDEAAEFNVSKIVSSEMIAYVARRTGKERQSVSQKKTLT
jgi:hypothetical protein